MVRKEEKDGKEDYEAGLKLAKLLRDSYNYSKPILCFAGSKYRQSNQLKFQQNGLNNVTVSSNVEDAEVWARFLSVPFSMGKSSSGR